MHNRFKEVRQATGLALRPFGERIGISGPSVLRIEAGTNNPSEQTIRAVCQQFNVNRHWLETGEGEMYDASPSDLVAQLAAEHNFGPGKTALLRAGLRVLDELGADVFDLVLKELKSGIPVGSTIGESGTLAAERSEPLGSEDDVSGN